MQLKRLKEEEKETIFARSFRDWGFRNSLPMVRFEEKCKKTYRTDGCCWKKSIFAKIFRRKCMSEKEMNTYRFNSGKEPSDEMLVQLMKEVAQEAKESNQKATEAHFAQMRRNIIAKKAKWAERINSITNG